MRILLVVPNSDTHYRVPPIGLGYIATAVSERDHEVSIYDGLKLRADAARLLEHVKAYKPHLVGIQVFSCDIPCVNEYLRAIKTYDPKIVTILGGAHPSGAPEDTLTIMPLADYAIAGEGEAGLSLLAKRLEKGDKRRDDIPGLIYKEGDETRYNPVNFQPNLDSLGFPRWDLIDPRSYPRIPQGVFYLKSPIAPISTTRGCPYPCTFCAGRTLMGKKIRAHSAEHVLEEIAMLVKDYGIRELHIVDDTFTTLRERAIRICQGIIDAGYDLAITFPNGVRLNTLDEELLSVLKKAGCYSMILGIESGSQRILDQMKKRLTVELIKEKVKLIDSFGIRTAGFFIIGYPSESEQDIHETIEFARKLPLKSAHFSNFLPLPGAEATEELKKAGIIEKIDYSKLFYSKISYTPRRISSKRLKQLQRKAYFRFYFRHKVFIDMLRQVRSFEHLLQLAKRFIDYTMKR